jgi:hypothetical protein
MLGGLLSVLLAYTAFALVLSMATPSPSTQSRAWRRGVLKHVGTGLLPLVEQVEWLFEHSDNTCHGFQNFQTPETPDFDSAAVSKAIKYYFYEKNLSASSSFYKNTFDVTVKDTKERHYIRAGSWKTIAPKETITAKPFPKPMDEFKTLVDCCPEFASEIKTETGKYLTGSATYKEVADKLFDDFAAKYKASFDKDSLIDHIGAFSRELRGASKQVPVGLRERLEQRYPGDHHIWAVDDKLNVLAFRLHTSAEMLEMERDGIRFLAIDDTFCVSLLWITCVFVFKLSQMSPICDHIIVYFAYLFDT